ncbi:MAG TPA: MFS transporter [Gemmatimonadaceae bacterium]|nr:MFS transporter [Gemmatimonadaceae bacterium]
MRTAGGFLVDVSPLRESPAFARLWSGMLVSGLGVQLTVIAVGLQVWELSHSTLAVSLVGVLGLAPLIVAGLYGGMLVDAFDRRRVLLAASLVAWASTIGLAVFAWMGGQSLWVLYMLTVVNSVAGAVVNIARTSVIAQLVRPELLPAAAALGGISAGLFVTAGPALAGVLVATVGFNWTYTIDAVLFLGALAAAYTLPALIPEGERHAPGIRSIKAGFAFLRGSPVVRASFLVDIAAMTLARPNALFPAVGATIIGGGAATVGAFTAAFAVGALLLSVLSGRLVRISRQGLAVSWSIAIYAASIGAFGLVLLATGHRGMDAAVAPSSLVFALLFLAVAGASDETSAIFRTTILQSAAPDNIRGRLQGVFTVVINGGPRLGDLFVGTLATVGALWLPPVLGGVLLLVTIAVLARSYSSFTNYRSSRSHLSRPPQCDQE